MGLRLAVAPRSPGDEDVLSDRQLPAHVLVVSEWPSWGLTGPSMWVCTHTHAPRPGNTGEAPPTCWAQHQGHSLSGKPLRGVRGEPKTRTKL